MTVKRTDERLTKKCHLECSNGTSESSNRCNYQTGAREMEDGSATPAASPGPVAAPASTPPPRDAFSSPDFSAVDFINRLFPDEASLAQVDPLIDKLRLRVRRVDDEILTAVRSQSTGGARAKADLDQAKDAILELSGRIQDIKSKAAQSEHMVQEICRDIKRLDFAKKHLTSTITALRRLSMLVTAVEQLETLSMRRQYRDSANLLEAVDELLTHFASYGDIPKIADLQKRNTAVKQTLRGMVFEDFHSTWMPTTMEQDPAAVARLTDACLVVDALEASVREELVGNLTNRELMNYNSCFDELINKLTLENIERRYAWIKRNLKSKEAMWRVFPPRWRVPQLLCMSMGRLTRTHVLEMLDTSGPHEVQATLQALHRTIEFEREMDEYFGIDGVSGGDGDGEGADLGADLDEDEDAASAAQIRARHSRAVKEKEVAEQRGGRALPMDSAAAALATTSFRGVISSSFDDHLGAYVEMEEKQLMEFVDELVSEETWGGPEPEDDSADPMKALLRKQQTAQRRTDALQGGTTEGQTLPSAATLFLNVKKVLRRCSNLTRGKPLCALHLVFVNVLTAYADRLRKRCDAAGTLLRTDMKQKDPEKLTAEYRCLCLVVNTAEWCAQTVTPLGESVTRMLADDNLKTRIDSDSIEDAFHQLVTHALGTLVSGVETRTEVAVGVTKVNWSQVESTGDESDYVKRAAATLATAVPPVRTTVRHDYFLFFCEKLAGSIAPGTYGAVFRCKKFTDTGAQQLLLDVHALKTILCELPRAGVLGKDEKPPAVPSSYARMVGREMAKVESLVKVILSPTEGLGDTFRALVPGGSGAEFRKVCELKGMARKEAEATAVRAFGAAALAQPKAATGTGTVAHTLATGQPGSTGVVGHQRSGSSGSSAPTHQRTGSGGGNLGAMNSSMFKGMNSSMFKMGGTSMTGMMDRAKDLSAKAASGMKEAADKAKDKYNESVKR